MLTTLTFWTLSTTGDFPGTAIVQVYKIEIEENTMILLPWNYSKSTFIIVSWHADDFNDWKHWFCFCSLTLNAHLLEKVDERKAAAISMWERSKFKGFETLLMYCLKHVHKCLSLSEALNWWWHGLTGDSIMRLMLILFFILPRRPVRVILLVNVSASLLPLMSCYVMCVKTLKRQVTWLWATSVHDELTFWVDYFPLYVS